jgi:dihydroflavonol-4-reductase
MRAFVTGGTGFVGSSLVRALRRRGDDVVALVRSPGRAHLLEDLGCELRQGDVGDPDLVRTSLEGCDAVFHCAGIYRVGIRDSERAAMYAVNVRGTEQVLDAAIDAGVRRVIHVSTVNVFGNTAGRVVDEGYRRPGNDFLSYYDETKFIAHEIAQERLARGAPILIVQPGGVYGPGDHSEIGGQIELMRAGKLRFLSFPNLGFNFVYVEDVADGMLLVHDEGRVGEAYVLGGELTTMRELIGKVAEMSGHRVPRLVMPVGFMRLAAPVAPLVGGIMGVPPNLREVIRAADGVTYWASDAKARRELGYSPRSLETGLGHLLAA